MNRISCQMRIGDVALYTFHNQRAGQGTPPAILYGIAKFVHAGGFAHDAIIDQLTTRIEAVNYPYGAIYSDTLFIGRDQQCNGTRMAGVFGYKRFDRGNESGKRPFHIRGSTPIQPCYRGLPA